MARCILIALVIALAAAGFLSACASNGAESATAANGRGNGDQGVAQPGNIADPAFIAQWAETYRFSLGKPASIKVVPDGSAVLFLRSGPRSQVRDLYEFDVSAGRERIIRTADQILQGGQEELTAEELARRERQRLTARGIASYELSKDGAQILINLSGRLFVITRASGEIRELPSGGGYPIDARFSPDGMMVACVRDGDLYVIDIESREQRRLTETAGGPVTNALAEFVAQEEMDRDHGYWWSPDSMFIAYQQTDTSALETMHIMDAMRPEQSPAEWPYPRPGKLNATVSLGVVPATGGETTWVEWDHDAYEYLATVKWSTEGAPLTIVVQNREQTEQAILAVDHTTGYPTTLHVERDEAWLNLDQSVPRWLEAGRGFLWTTERGGAWQIELRDPTGGFVRNITAPELMLGKLVSVNESLGEIIVTASPDDPTQSHVFRIPLEAEMAAPKDPAVQRLTHRPGMHGAVFSRDHSTWVESVSALDGESLWTIRRADGMAAGRLESVAEEPPFSVRLELTTVGSRPKIHCAIIRPRNFDPTRQYPVIVSVYGGPHAQTVTANADRYLLQQWMADHGYIVVSMDGRGTPTRGRAWERAIKGELIAIPLSDQVEALRALRRKHRELDLTRVGVFGWSFGGYFSAHAVMQRPEVFHAAVAGAPVAAWEDYDTHYTERYMGLPQDNPAGYASASVLTHCPNLDRPLLIIHGTADDNVYFMHSLKMADALFRAGKEFEFLPLPGFTHMVPDPVVMQSLYTRIMGHFEEHLGASAAE